MLQYWHQWEIPKAIWITTCPFGFIPVRLDGVFPSFWHPPTWYPSSESQQPFTRCNHLPSIILPSTTISSRAYQQGSPSRCVVCLPIRPHLEAGSWNPIKKYQRIVPIQWVSRNDKIILFVSRKYLYESLDSPTILKGPVPNWIPWYLGSKLKLVTTMV